jgi:hypothetical protein
MTSWRCINIVPKWKLRCVPVWFDIPDNSPNRLIRPKIVDIIKLDAILFDVYEIWYENMIWKTKEKNEMFLKYI